MWPNVSWVCVWSTWSLKARELAALFERRRINGTPRVRLLIDRQLGLDPSYHPGRGEETDGWMDGRVEGMKGGAGNSRRLFERGDRRRRRRSSGDFENFALGFSRWKLNYTEKAPVPWREGAFFFFFANKSYPEKVVLCAVMA